MIKDIMASNERVKLNDIEMAVLKDLFPVPVDTTAAIIHEIGRWKCEHI
jgi:hypothetical protein